MSKPITIEQFREKVSLLQEKLTDTNTGLSEKLKIVAADSQNRIPNSSVPNVTPFEEGLRSHIEEHQVKSIFYWIYDYAFLLDSGVEFLSRAISLRDDGKELGLRAFNDFLDMWTRENDIELTKLTLAEKGEYGLQLAALENTIARIEAQSEFISEKLEESKAKLEKKPDPQWIQLQTEQLGLANSLASANSARSILKEKVDMAHTNVALSQILHDVKRAGASEPGHALNHAERVETTRKAFLKNIAEAYSRLLAASQGLGFVFPNNQSATGFSEEELTIGKFPDILSDTSRDEIGYTDTLLDWARATFFTLDRITAVETEFQLLVSMKQMQLTKRGALLGTLHFEFVLAPSDFKNLQNLRINSIQVYPNIGTYNDDTEDEYNLYNGTFKGRLLLPPQGGGDLEVQYAFGGATQYRESNGEMTSSTATRNASPLGNWQLILDSFMHNFNEPKDVSDVWIKLVVTGTTTPTGILFDPTAAPIRP